MEGASNAERYQIEQLFLRLGRKRALAALEQTYPSDYAEIENGTLTKVLASTTLLARLLSPLWPEVWNLSLVCKRFEAATKHREFWMPAVRGYLRRSYAHLKLSFINYINPFFQFPEHMYMCPGWKWNTFIEWLFYKPIGRKSYVEVDRVYGAGIGGKQQYRVAMYWRGQQAFSFEMSDDESFFSTTWYTLPMLRDSRYAIAFSKSEESRNSQFRSAYSIVVNGAFVWVDGPVGLDGRSWCGAVRDSPIEFGAVTAREGHGFYRDEK